MIQLLLSDLPKLLYTLRGFIGNLYILGTAKNILKVLQQSLIAIGPALGGHHTYHLHLPLGIHLKKTYGTDQLF